MNNLILVGGTNISVADFIGDTNTVIISSSPIPLLEIDEHHEIILQFKLYLNKDSDFHNQGFIFDSSNNYALNCHLSMMLHDSSIFFAQKNTYNDYSILGKNNQILNCEIYKNYSGDNISYFKINGIAQTEGTLGVSAAGTYNGVGIGLSGYSFSAWTTDLSTLGDATIWDVKMIEASTNTLLHYWKGYPEGNTVSAWKDQVGSLDAIGNTVIGSRDINDIEIYGGKKLKISNNYLYSNKLLLNYPIEIGPYVILLTTKGNKNYSNFISYDKGVTFNENADLSTYMLSTSVTDPISAPYTYISPNTKHLMVGYYDSSKSGLAWSHDSGITWDASTQKLETDGYTKCSDDGTIMVKGSIDNVAGTGIMYSKDSGTTWSLFEPAVGADNRKYFVPVMNATGKYIMSNSQYVGSGVKMIFSSDYGDNCAYLEDIDNPTYFIRDGFGTNRNNVMSSDGKYMLNLVWGTVQNSSDYGYSWYTIFTGSSGTSQYYMYGAMSLTGQYQVYQKNEDSSIYFSNDYGVSFNKFNKNIGGEFSCKPDWIRYSLDMMNMVGIDVDLKTVWRNKNFDSNGWYNSYTFTTNILNFSMSSDGNVVLMQTTDASIFYSWDGGDTFSKSTFENPLAPSSYLYLAIN